MKKSLMFMSAAVLALSTVLISSCSDDEGGGGSKVPPAKIKTIAFNDGSAIESWEFTYVVQVRVSSISNVYDGGDPSIMLTRTMMLQVS